MINTDIAIIGAGFAGIAAGYAAKEKNLQATLFEADVEWGGLCGNFSVDGFRFDRAVHLAFNEPPIVERLFLSRPHYSHSSESRNYADGFWVRHPVQNNLRELPVEERIKVICSFIGRPNSIDFGGHNNYRQWLEFQFGQYFAEKYPARYTRKYWGTDAANLNCNWCGGRIYQPSIEEVLRGAFSDSPKPANVYYAKSMHYPKEGGYKNFVAELAAQIDICCGHKVTAIDTTEKILTFANGKTCHYKKLVSTMPLPRLAKLITNDEKILAAADNLQTTSMALVSVGYSKAFDFPTNWFYVYDEDIPFARVHSPSRKSPDNAPQGCSSLQFEIYYSRELPLKLSDDELITKTLDAMEKMDVATRADVAALDCRHVEFANVIFYDGMEQARELVRREVARHGITSCGRFGEWDYLWSTQSFMSGYNSMQEGFQ